MRLVPVAVPLGVYVNRKSPLHRAPAGGKLLAIVAFIAVIAMVTSTPWQALAGAAVVALAYLVARVPPRTAWGQLWPTLPIFAFLGAVLWWQSGLEAAATTVIMLATSVMAGCLLTLTTPAMELLDSLELGLRPLRRVGVPAERISLAISLTLRLIPLQLAAINEAAEARKARGAEGSLRALVVPVMVRALRRAENMAEALWARGAGDS